MKKRLSACMLCIMLLFVCVMPTMAYEYNSDSVTVYVTVNDITDIDNPINTVVERTELTVSNFDISAYGEDFCGIPILDSGVTYLHVLVKLHEVLYGAEAVSENFKIDSDGYTRIFMGRSVGSIMYKNGDYIFALPQYINVHNGDEVNICLYDEGYNQAIASFDKSFVDVSVGESLDLNIFKHHWYPEYAEAVEGAYIVDENGDFVLDENYQFVISDENGDFSLTFNEEGFYRLTVLPTVGYYMSQKGGNWVIWWEEIEKIREVEKQRAVSQSGTYIDSDSLSATTATGKAVNAIKALNEATSIDIVSWDNMPAADEIDGDITYSVTNSPLGDISIKEVTYGYETYIIEETYTELVKHEEFVSGEATQKVDYTTPWVLVNVTNDFTFTEVSRVGNTLYVSAINSDKHTGQIICAAYDYDESGTRLLSSVTMAELADETSFTYSDEHDEYILYAWKDNMQPLTAKYKYTGEVLGLEWNSTMPKPDNVIIIGDDLQEDETNV